MSEPADRARELDDRDDRAWARTKPWIIRIGASKRAVFAMGRASALEEAADRESEAQVQSLTRERDAALDLLDEVEAALPGERDLDAGHWVSALDMIRSLAAARAALPVPVEGPKHVESAHRVFERDGEIVVAPPITADGMVRVFIDNESYRVRPDVAGEFLLSLRPLPRDRLQDWQVWREVPGREDEYAGWDRPLNLTGDERFYTTPSNITAGSVPVEGPSVQRTFAQDVVEAMLEAAHDHGRSVERAIEHGEIDSDDQEALPLTIEAAAGAAEDLLGRSVNPAVPVEGEADR